MAGDILLESPERASDHQLADAARRLARHCQG
jgi:hypothetical protein